MVSFADIQSIYRNEKNIPSLQILTKEFYSEAAELIGSLDGEHKTHIQKLVEEITVRRRNKIILHALRTPDETIPPTNILPDEEELFGDVVALIKKHQKRTLSKKPPAKKQEPDTPSHETVSVKILQAIPEIVGSDSKTYGPFKEDSVVSLPADSARILLDKGFAEES